MSLQRILYVEDEPDIQAIGRLALEVVGGFTLEIHGSGREALERVAVFDPDLILLDVMMPGMDGPSILEALTAMPSMAGKPVVFVTAKARPHEVRRYLDLGAADVIPKPFDAMKLADQIREIFDRFEESRRSGCSGSS